MDILIPISRGLYSVIDDIDLELVSSHQWHVTGEGKYAGTNVTLPDGSKTIILMHRIIMGVVKGQYVDHRDRDGLNNRRINLRIVTNRQNAMNMRPGARHRSSRFKGVSFRQPEAKARPWLSQIKVNGRNRKLGNFETEEQAARAYDVGAHLYYGEFACTNVMLGFLPPLSNNIRGGRLTAEVWV